MLLTTRKKPLKKISELTFDLEIVNPIESKNLFGGCEYHSYCSCTGSLIIWNNYNNSNNNYNDNSNHILNGGYHSDWDKANWGNDYNNNNYDPWVDNNHEHYTTDNLYDAHLDSYDKHICTQLDGSTTCATMALSYLANHFGATGLSSSDFAEMAGKNYMAMTIGSEEGLNGVQLTNIMASIFNSTLIQSYDQIIASLNNNHPVLASIQVGAGIGHEVVITYLDTVSGNISYMDSWSGTLVNSNMISNNIVFAGNMFEVSGIQNNSKVNQYKNDSNDIICTICGH